MSLLLKALQRAQQQSTATPSRLGDDRQLPAVKSPEALASTDVLPTHNGGTQLSHAPAVTHTSDEPLALERTVNQPLQSQTAAGHDNSEPSRVLTLELNACESLPDSYPAKLDAAIAAIESLRADEAGPLVGLSAACGDVGAAPQSTPSPANVLMATPNVALMDPGLNSCAAALICHVGNSPFCASIFGLDSVADDRSWQAGLATALGSQLFGDVLLIHAQCGTLPFRTANEAAVINPSDFLADDFDREQAITKTEYLNLRELTLQLPLDADAQHAAQLARIVRDCKRDFQAVLIDCGVGNPSALQVGSIAHAGDATVLAVPLGKIDHQRLRDAAAQLVKLRAPRVACIAVQSAYA